MKMELKRDTCTTKLHVTNMQWWFMNLENTLDPQLTYAKLEMVDCDGTMQNLRWWTKNDQ